ncbi:MULTISPECIES: hypothetical protein [unclassified Pseudoclavibacter]|uniref:hypothetical protein n=1 Tax=unclassified Pseudoclavibacter TaxID=2615177 RepID=UPI001BAE239C|nr:hypothetical protein [Pseudoclavibacter sp. Marseille-Q4354]MBS3179861.1 hypothetical protein [Pseudoclavibacter sp. Marseille-Q4354]
MTKTVKRAERARALHSAGFSLFGEMLLVGVVCALLFVPFITAVAGVAAGVRHLRRHVDGRSDTMREFLADAWRCVRALVGFGALFVLWMLWLGFDLWALTRLEIPGASVVSVVVALAGVASLVAVLRLVGRWNPAAPIRHQLRAAVRLVWRDPAGSALLVFALGLAVLLVWMYPPMFIVTGGVISLAVVGVELRPRSRAPFRRLAAEVDEERYA